MSDITYTPVANEGRVAAFFHGVATSVAQYRLYRTTLAELQSLGDRELADLGLNRSVLRSVAYRAAYKA